MSALDDLRTLVGADAADDAALTSDLQLATDLVDRYLDDAGDPDDLPPVGVKTRATVQVAADLFNRRNAPNGVVLEQYGEEANPVPVRLGRDPVASARDLLAPWVIPVAFA